MTSSDIIPIEQTGLGTKGHNENSTFAAASYLLNRIGKKNKLNDCIKACMHQLVAGRCINFNCFRLTRLEIASAVALPLSTQKKIWAFAPATCNVPKGNSTRTVSYDTAQFKIQSKIFKLFFSGRNMRNNGTMPLLPTGKWLCFYSLAKDNRRDPTTQRTTHGLGIIRKRLHAIVCTWCGLPLKTLCFRL